MAHTTALCCDGDQPSRVFKHYYSELVEILPMGDSVFTAKLFSNDLLPGDLKNEVELLHRTPANKAAFFLDHVIKPSVTSGAGSSFDTLLTVMENSEGLDVKQLAKQIRTSLKKRFGLHSATAESTSEPAPKKVRSTGPIDVGRLKARYLRLQPTAKTDRPIHKVTQYIRLALVEKEDVTLKDDNLNEVTKLTLQGDVDKILKKKQPLNNLSEIFHYENTCPRLIVIMGGPGIGKTTLAHEICVRWARDGFLSEDFDAVVLLPLRCVHRRSLEEVLIEFIGEEVYQQLNNLAGNRCLIILEGLDEMSIDRQENDRFYIRLIRDCTVLEKSTILLTSRPHACGKLNPDRQVEVIGFGAEQIEEFIKRSLPDDEKSVSELLQQLNDYPHIKGMCYVPLNLVMITDIFKCRQKKLPSTLTELYKLFLVMTLTRHAIKKDYVKCTSSGASLTAAGSASLKEMLPGIPIESVGPVFLLCKLSFSGIFHGMQEELWYVGPKIIFTKEDLIQCGIEVTSEYDGLGLLKATHIHDVPTDTSVYNFSHLTIQEISDFIVYFLTTTTRTATVNE